MMRAVLAIVVGVAIWGGLWTGSNAALSSALPEAFDTEGFPRGSGVLLAFLAISVLLSILAGYLAAWITKQNPMRVVTILALVQLAIGIAVQTSVWNEMPVWYHVPFLLMVVPAHLLGSWIRLDRKPTWTASDAPAV